MSVTILGTLADKLLGFLRVSADLASTCGTAAYYVFACNVHACTLVVSPVEQSCNLLTKYADNREFSAPRILHHSTSLSYAMPFDCVDDNIIIHKVRFVIYMALLPDIRWTK